MNNWLNKALALFLLLAMMLPASVLAEAAEENDNYVVIYFQDGSKVRIPASIADDAQALSDYCAAYFPGRLYTRDEDTLEATDAVLSAEWTAQQYGEGSRAMGVWMVTLGLHESVVKTTNGEITVPTRYLTFAADSDSEHQVAVVHAPRTGEASLREKASSNGAKVATCLTGRIVPVLEYNGSTFTKILYDGVEGYIRTDCLIFQNTSEEIWGSAMLSVKGEVGGQDNVMIRSTESTSTANVGEWKTGTLVTVLSKEGDWYRVEADGWCGYVQKQYLTMKEE